MGYVKQTLAPGEIYVYRAFFHWLYDVQSWFWLFVGITPITFWAWLQVSNHAQAEHFGRFFIGISTLAAILGVWAEPPIAQDYRVSPPILVQKGGARRD